MNNYKKNILLSLSGVFSIYTIYNLYNLYNLYKPSQNLNDISLINCENIGK